MNLLVLPFNDINKSTINLVGGKGANLGELTHIEGIHVPDGFCITTEAFKRIVEETPAVKELIDQLSTLKSEDRKTIISLTADIRATIDGLPIPDDISVEITRLLTAYGEENAYAVRSSATAEDLANASFAGQQDTYLNIIGKASILKHISKCWASLFTERAVTYRIQHNFDHHKVQMCVVVQQMVFPQAAGILFTADPISNNRKLMSIDASFGLGEAVVSGLVNADIYKVKEGKIADKKVSTKKLAIYALKDGGTKEQAIEPAHQNAQVLTDEQILQLERIGRKIEAHFGYPQDIEWCLVNDKIYIVQSRPITTLYPAPVAEDNETHVYISTGHQQMMTDAMKPLGLSFFLLFTPAKTAIAGGRLFVDITAMLKSPPARESLMTLFGRSEPLLKDALTNLLERGDVIPHNDKNEQNAGPGNKPVTVPDYHALNDYDPAVVVDLIGRMKTLLEESKKTIQTKSGSDLFDFILEDIQELKKITSDPQSFGVIMTGMNAAAWINEKVNEWLGEKNIADTLTQSVSSNVTSEMGLALLDVADVIRPYPEVISYLQHVNDDNFPDKMVTLNGGKEARDAINAYLDKYGMRCVGEIDITKTRWSEKPITLVPLILGNIKNFEPGAGKRKFEQGLQEALKKEQELLDRLRQLPDGEQKAVETKRMIDLVRNLSGYREYPKYNIVSHFFIHKLALLKEAERLVKANIIHQVEDVYFLSFEEFREAVRKGKLDYEVINKRKEEFKLYEKLTPPRVITSDGEIITGSYKRKDTPLNAIVGLPVSAGVIEGRARVIFKVEDADLKEGDILVTTFTDPSWTPLFVSIKGFVTEVGGLITHGAVIAREYGIPAVVGVENATKLIKDGQRIRVHGTDGYVEIV